MLIRLILSGVTTLLVVATALYGLFQLRGAKFIKAKWRQGLTSVIKIRKLRGFYRVLVFQLCVHSVLNITCWVVWWMECKTTSFVFLMDFLSLCFSLFMLSLLAFFLGNRKISYALGTLVVLISIVTTFHLRILRNVELYEVPKIYLMLVSVGAVAFLAMISSVHSILNRYRTRDLLSVSQFWCFIGILLIVSGRISEYTIFYFILVKGRTGLMTFFYPLVVNAPEGIPALFFLRALWMESHGR